MKKILDKIFNGSAQAAQSRSEEKNNRKRQVGTRDDVDFSFLIQINANL